MNMCKKTGERLHSIEDDYYNVQQFVDVFHGLNITVYVDETNGFASLVTHNEVKISKGLKLMLGFGNKRKFEANTTHVGDKSVDLATIKYIYIYTSGTVKYIA